MNLYHLGTTLLVPQILHERSCNSPTTLGIDITTLSFNLKVYMDHLVGFVEGPQPCSI